VRYTSIQKFASKAILSRNSEPQEDTAFNFLEATVDLSAGRSDEILCSAFRRQVLRIMDSLLVWKTSEIRYKSARAQRLWAPFFKVPQPLDIMRDYSDHDFECMSGDQGRYQDNTYNVPCRQVLDAGSQLVNQNAFAEEALDKKLLSGFKALRESLRISFTGFGHRQ